MLFRSGQSTFAMALLTAAVSRAWSLDNTTIQQKDSQKDAKDAVTKAVSEADTKIAAAKKQHDDNIASAKGKYDDAKTQ